jgi:hypothetical protein
MDGLPVLYLVGFVILAASLIYLWKHPGLPRSAALEVARMDTLRAQINAIQGRVDQLEAKPVPDLGPIQAQLADLSRRPTPAAPPPVDLSPLIARIAALEARPAPPPVDLRPIEARIATLERKPPVDLGPVQQKIDAVSAKDADAVAALSRRLDAIAAKAAQSGRLQAAAGALEAGQSLGDIPGAPPALARFAHEAPPTEAGLRLGFDTAAEAAHAASQPALTDDKPLLSRMWTRAQQAVTVRQGDHVLVGDPIAGIIASARQSLDAGDLAGAVKALDGMNGPAKAAMADWIARAKSLLDARAAIGEMAARG